MSRTRALVFASLFAVTTLAGVGTAQGQDYPGTSAPPNGETCTLTISANLPMLANATVNVTLSCGAVVAGRAYTGSLASTPVALASTTATANGAVTFNNVTLPADWELNANHTARLVDQATGATLGAVQFYVDGRGQITGPPKGNLPRTGTDYVGPVARGAAVLLAGGALALLVARRRRTAPVA